MFAWHKEDLDLYSINYLHFGKPKCWYGIPSNEDEEFEKLARTIFPNAYQDCKEFMRHKTYLINPLIVKNKGVTVHKCVQNPGEFVITFGASYHAGFNMGYNCAEAVNFALDRWIPLGKKAGVCKCSTDSVKIDMDCFENNVMKPNARCKKLVEPVIKIRKEKKLEKPVNTRRRKAKKKTGVKRRKKNAVTLI
jgi:jumonji domain-containing protein 2